MKQLILLSKHFTKPAQDALEEMTGKKLTKIKVAFSQDPADMKDNKDYVYEARDELVDAGLHINDFTLHDFKNKPEKLEKYLLNFDATYFSGGNVIYFNHLINKYNLRDKYRQLVLDGKFVHTGSSAGAMITAKTMKYNREIDVVEGISKEFDSLGLDLFEHNLCAHYVSKEKYTKLYEKVT